MVSVLKSKWNKAERRIQRAQMRRQPWCRTEQTSSSAANFHTFQIKGSHWLDDQRSFANALLVQIPVFNLFICMPVSYPALSGSEPHHHTPPPKEWPRQEFFCGRSPLHTHTSLAKGLPPFSIDRCDVFKILPFNKIASHVVKGRAFSIFGSRTSSSPYLLMQKWWHRQRSNVNFDYPP